MKKSAALVFLLFHAHGASAQIFSTDTTIINPSGETATIKQNYDIAGDFFDDVSNSGFERLFPIYSFESVVTANTVYNGLPINIAFPVSNSTKLVFDIPELGISKTFIKGTRSQSTNALEHYLRNDVDGTASRIAQYQIGNTGTSQLAGNPASLQGQLVANNFDSAVRVSSPANAQANNRFAVGVGGGSYFQKGIDVDVINVPISQEFSIDSDNPGRKLLLNGQFNYVTIGEAASFQGGLGIGYAHPINDHWSIIPGVSYGVIGSVDLYSLGQIFSTSLASNYRFNIGDYTLSTTNMFGYYKTLPLNVSGAQSDPDISNYVVKNGFFVDKILPFTAFGHKLNIKGIFTDTEFFGSKVFVRQYNEVGFEIKTADSVKWLDTVTFGITDTLSINAKYVFSIENPNNFEGYEISTGYNF